MKKENDKMNKYIKINTGVDSGIYKICIDKKRKEEGISNYYYIEVRKGIYLTFDGEYLKKFKLGDTIEELCDKFVYVYNKNNHTFIAAFQFKTYLEFDGIIYGAIWTDKGLIYVAKMNEKKGKLELI